MKPPPSAQTVRPAAATGATPLLPPACGTLRTLCARSYVRAQGAHLVFSITLLNSVISWIFYYFLFVWLFIFSPPKLSHIFLPKTFTYDSRTWGQVMVSPGETSLFCCCCCCWTVRFSIRRGCWGGGGAFWLSYSMKKSSSGMSFVGIMYHFNIHAAV